MSEYFVRPFKCLPRLLCKEQRRLGLIYAQRMMHLHSRVQQDQLGQTQAQALESVEFRILFCVRDALWDVMICSQHLATRQSCLLLSTVNEIQEREKTWSNTCCRYQRSEVLNRRFRSHFQLSELWALKGILAPVRPSYIILFEQKAITLELVLVPNLNYAGKQAVSYCTYLLPWEKSGFSCAVAAGLGIVTQSARGLDVDTWAAIQMGSFFCQDSLPFIPMEKWPLYHYP